MSDTQESLENNWYKAIKGIKCTRLGIKTFVKENVDKFRQKVYAAVLQGLPSGSTCSACTIQNVLPCPTRHICGKKSNCSFHDKNDPGCQPKQCPNNICNKVKDEIINAHRHKGPSFRNTSATLWSSSSWDIAKCFMAATGYQDKMSADDTDFPGMISVILNLVDFQGLVSENLGQKNNVFEQAREARNTIMHSAGFELSSSDLKSHFAVFMKILTDAKHIQGRPEAQEAVKKLQMILADQRIITEKEKESLRKEALAAIKTVEEAKNEAVAEMLLKENEIVSTASTAKRNIEEAENLATKEVESKRDEALNSLEMKLQEAYREIASSGEVTRDALSKGMEVSVTGVKDDAITELEEKSRLLVVKAKQDIQVSMESSQDVIAKKAEESLKELESNTKQNIKEMEKHKQEMIDLAGKSVTATKTEAIEELEEIKYTLLEETKLAMDKAKDDALEKIYKTRELAKTEEEGANLHHQQTSEHDGFGESLGLKDDLLDQYPRIVLDVLADYSQIGWELKDDNDSINDFLMEKRIANFLACIDANGGYGKTTFCDMTIFPWYVFLRDVYGVVEPIIKLLLIKQSLHVHLAVVLRKESRKCFILLGGLDEWSGGIRKSSSNRQKRTSFSFNDIKTLQNRTIKT